MRRYAVAAAVVLAALTVAPAAQADITSVFDGDLTCTNFEAGTPGDTSDDQRRCGQDGTNEVQTVEVTATGGTFTLTFDGETTAALAFDATSATVDAALEGLSSVGAGAVSVTGPPSDYTVTFSGSLARTDVPQITGDGSGLTGPGAGFDIATPTPGVVPSTTPTWDGVPIDANVAFPEAAEGDGPFPLLVWGHGYGGAKIGFGAMKQFTDRGYAVMALQARGFHESCGSTASRRREGAACDEGWVHLMDTRYEIRDYQHLAGRLVDESRAVPDEIGALGGSYGGGLSMALGALRNRTMLPDGTLVPWESPDDVAMELAAASPNIPWTDLSYSLTPNGRNLDYVVDNEYGDTVGVMKQSLTNGLYLAGQGAPGFYSPPGVDPEADLTGWRNLLLAGEPYGGEAEGIIAEISNHHSSYYIDDSVAPAPMLISNGFTDDLFPGDEALRFYNRTRVNHPSVPISLLFGDFGHQRAANKNDVRDALNDRQDAWLDFYVKGEGPQPPNQVEAWTQTCPSTAATPSAGPFTAANWIQLAKGELRLTDPAERTIAPDGGTPGVATAFNPVTAANACATTSGADEAGTVNYRMPALSADATLMGSATVVADVDSPSPNNQIAARLLDVAPGGEQRLVARGLFRPEAGNRRQVFQLHPNGYTFAAGHVPKLQLLAKDSSGDPTGGTNLAAYGRQSNGQTAITVSDVEVRLPVTQQPGGQVLAPQPKPVPCGETAVPELGGAFFKSTLGDGAITLKKGKVRVPVQAAPGPNACPVRVELLGKKPKGKKKKKKKGKKSAAAVLASATAQLGGGEQAVVVLKPTKAGKRALSRGRRSYTVRIVTADPAGQTTVAAKAKLGAKKKKKGKKKK